MQEEKVITRYSQFKYEPINTTITEVAFNLHIGSTAFVQLEPGEGTRYEFYLIPMTREFRVSGTDVDYVMVCIFGPNSHSGCYPMNLQFLKGVKESELSSWASYLADHLCRSSSNQDARQRLRHTCMVICNFLSRLGAA